jgi:L-threonylcarbamoyladenylate synthase
MTRRHTRCLASDSTGIEAAAVILRGGGLVAFPTETVYGLGAHALDGAAVRGIFEAKGRPADDPVIVHVASAEDVRSVALLNERAVELGKRFWPGPLTLVLPKRVEVPSEVTAGLNTVGVRVPSHPVARALLSASQIPVAAPSANLFGRPSPTTARHVMDDLHGRIDAVVDGGPTTVGVESTIVDLSSQVPRLLRPGGLAAEAIEAVLGVQLASARQHGGAQEAPGMLAVHYAPRTPLTLVRGTPEVARERLLREVRRASDEGRRVGVIALAEDAGAFPEGVHVQVVGKWNAPEETARRLFGVMRALDGKSLDALFVRDLAARDGLGRALADRLNRASQRVIEVRE